MAVEGIKNFCSGFRAERELEVLGTDRFPLQSLMDAVCGVS